jgi:carbon monoxide dehydrogenase subunit G
VIRVEHSVEISRPPEEVFARLTDVERIPEWQSSALSAHADGPLAQGSRLVEKRRLMGRELEHELEVVAFDPPSRLTLCSLGGPVKLTIDHELAAVGDGTRVTVSLTGEAGTLMKLAEPMLARTAEAELRRDFQQLKELLEGDTGTSGYRVRR